MPVAAVALFGKPGSQLPSMRVTQEAERLRHNGAGCDSTVHRCRDRRPHLVTSLELGGFPPAIALAITINGAIVILMMVLAEWPD